MTYPLSSDVTSGQPTAYQHYNNLRADALYLGQLSTDVVALAVFLSRFISNVRIDYLATNRLRVPYSLSVPPTIMINGCMCQAAAHVDLASSSFSGGAATWYIFAKRTAGSTTFTLEVNTANTESSTTRLIGEVYWDGTDLVQSSVKTYSVLNLPTADYDSGWFAVAHTTTYTKAHAIGYTPRIVRVWHAAVAAPGPGDELVEVITVDDSAYTTTCVVGCDATNVYIQTGQSMTGGTIKSMRRLAADGYYKILAWR